MKNGAIAAFVSGALISAIALGWMHAGRAPDASPPSVADGGSVAADASPTPEAAPAPLEPPRAAAGQAPCTERPRDLETEKAPAPFEGRQMGSVLLGRIDPPCGRGPRAAGDEGADAAPEPLVPRTPEAETDMGLPTRPSAEGTAAPAPPALSAGKPSPPIESALRPSISPSPPGGVLAAPRRGRTHPVPCCRSRPPTAATRKLVAASSHRIVRARY